MAGETVAGDETRPGHGLLGFAGHEFKLNTRQKDGATLREHLESVQRQTGITPKELEPLDVPYALEYLWQWFCELSAGRHYSEYGPQSLSYTEMLAWARLTGKQLMVWEVETLKRIDAVYITEAMRKN